MKEQDVKVLMFPVSLMSKDGKLYSGLYVDT